MNGPGDETHARACPPAPVHLRQRPSRRRRGGGRAGWGGADHGDSAGTARDRGAPAPGDSSAALAGAGAGDDEDLSFWLAGGGGGSTAFVLILQLYIYIYILSPLSPLLSPRSPPPHLYLATTCPALFRAASTPVSSVDLLVTANHTRMLVSSADNPQCRPVHS